MTTKKDKKKKWRVWTHFDSGVEQIVEARTWEEAIDIAEDTLDNSWSMDPQIEDNLQMGDSNATEIKGKTRRKKNEQRTGRK